MKQNPIILRSLGALMMAGAAVISCTQEPIEEIVNEKPVNNGSQACIMTVTANKGGDTKALGFVGSELTSTWSAEDVVRVYNGNAEIGELTVSNLSGDGKSCTLSGPVNPVPANGATLTLKYLSASYSTQDGTLTGNATSIDKVCDYAVSEVTASVSGNTVTTTDADFINQQAIVKFTLKKKADNSDLEIPAAMAFTVSDGTNVYTITPDEATHVLFVAIPTTSNVNLSTTIGAIDYSYEKTGANLVAGKYYEITVKMVRGTVDLARVTGNTTLLNGDTVTGTLGGNYKISVAAGATITLSGVTIQYTNDGSNSNWAGINCLGDANLILDGENTVVSGFDTTKYNNYPGIHIPEGSTLTITGTDSDILNVSNGDDGRNEGGYAAGIGGGWRLNCGNIVIQGGRINATGGSSSAGIGGGYSGSCGCITITNGIVTAQGGNRGGTGIGSGSGTDTAPSTCGNIEISGGTVTATGGQMGAGIGSAGTGNGNVSNDVGSCSNIIISGGTVTVNGGDYAAGVGTGPHAACGDISFDGGSIVATAGSSVASSIGAGSSDGSCMKVTINTTITRVEMTNGNTNGNLNSFISANAIWFDKTDMTNFLTLHFDDGASYYMGAPKYLLFSRSGNTLTATPAQ